MSRCGRVTAVPLLFAAGAALSGCALSLQALPKVSDVSTATYPVRAVFADVLNLSVDAQVRVGAEVVGQVGAISTRNFEADLTLDIRRAVRLPVGTTAQVRFDDPLGEEYVMLQPPTTLSSSVPTPTTSFLGRGSLIPESSTSTAPSVEDTLGALSLVLNGGGINQLGTIIHELNGTFGGNQPSIRSFLTTINQGVTSLSSGRSAIDNALTSMSNLTKELNGGGSTIATGIGTIGPAIGVLAGEDQQISDLIGQLSNLGAVGTQIADDSGQDSVSDARDLLPVIEQLEAASSQLAPDLADLTRFESETPDVAPGDYLQASATIDVSLPPGGYEPTPLPDAVATPTSAGPVSGAAAVTDLLAAGIS